MIKLLTRNINWVFVQPLLRCANAAVYSLGPDISEIIIIWLRVRLIDCIPKLELSQNFATDPLYHCFWTTERCYYTSFFKDVVSTRFLNYTIKHRVCKFYWWVESVWLLLHKFWSHFGISGVKYHNEKNPFSEFQQVVLACICCS